MPYLYELAEGCIGWVVSDQETHILISNFHGGWTVHNGKEKCVRGLKKKSKKGEKIKKINNLGNVSQQKTLKKTTKMPGIDQSLL